MVLARKPLHFFFYINSIIIHQGYASVNVVSKGLPFDIVQAALQSAKDLKVDYFLHWSSLARPVTPDTLQQLIAQVI